MTNHPLASYAAALESAGLLTAARLADAGAQPVTNLTYDSRAVTPGTLFVCKGAAFKPDYLVAALAAGAIGYVAEQELAEAGAAPALITGDIRRAMPVLADLFFASPWRELTIVGFGGTKGKSTSAYYFKAVVDDFLAAAGKPESAVISSIDTYDGVVRKESVITTPEAIELYRHLRNAVDAGISHVAMEVTSQALKYHRVDGIRLDVGTLLNVSEDHISPVEHADFEDYLSSKLLMFAQTETAIISQDCEHYDRIEQAAQAAGRTLTIATTPADADYVAHNAHKADGGIAFSVRGPSFEEEFSLQMPGLFNVENALAVIAAADALGIPREFTHSGLARATSSGRMEEYANADRSIVAIVDYAHNKLSFDKLFSSMALEYPDYRIVAIFGCPGYKAYVRRKDLGEIAGKYSAKVYLTAEDPGKEPIAQISAQIAEHVAAQGCPYAIIDDRRDAIATAINEAHGKTLLLITGKGNETRQKFGTEYVPYPSDVQIVTELLNRANTT